MKKMKEIETYKEASLNLAHTEREVLKMIKDYDFYNSFYLFVSDVLKTIFKNEAMVDRLKSNETVQEHVSKYLLLNNDIKKYFEDGDYEGVKGCIFDMFNPLYEMFKECEKSAIESAYSKAVSISRYGFE